MARKALSALCVFFIFLISGCAADRGNSPLTDFSADFTAEFNGMSLSGNITADRRGLLCMEIKTPETLSGLTISCKDGETELKRDELICTADEAYLPQSSLPSRLKAALSALSSSIEDKKTKPQNGCYLLPDYEIYTDKSGSITRITSADGSMDIEFNKLN